MSKQLRGPDENKKGDVCDTRMLMVHSGVPCKTTIEVNELAKKSVKKFKLSTSRDHMAKQRPQADVSEFDTSLVSFHGH